MVEYSDYKYDKICLVFKNKIKKSRGEYVDELCNAIVPLTGESYTALPNENNMGEADI